MKKLSTLRTAAMGLMVAALAMVGRADDDAPVKSGVVARIAIGSAQQIQDLADELGIPMPPIATPAGVEGLCPFLGRGGFNKDLPVAVDIVAGTGVTQAQRAIFYLPTNDGHAPISDFLKHGAKLGDDGAIVQRQPFRRVGDYLMFGGTADAITAVSPDDLAKEMADHPLLYISYDIKKVRDLEPELMEAQKKVPRGQHQAPGEQAGREFGMKFVENIDKMTMLIEKKPTAFHVTMGMHPFEASPEKTWKRPGMPSDLAGRIDYQLPGHWSKSFFAAARKAVGDDQLFKDKDMDIDTPAKKEKFMSAVEDLAEVLIGGDETSVGVGTLSDSWVVYIVTQSAAPRDGHDQWMHVVDEIKAIDINEKDNLKPSQFTADNGDTGDRLTLEDHFVIDSIDHGGTRMITVTAKPGTAISKLMTAKSSSSLTTAAAGWVDIQKVIELTAMVPDSGIPKLSNDDEDLINKVLDHQRISFSATTKDQKLDLSFDVPLKLVKNLIAHGGELAQMASRMQGD